MTEREIIEGCQNGDAVSQRKLYERYAGVMFGVCCRYVGDRSIAEDLLHDGFITVFTKINDFRGDGSFEGWCRRIFVNTALGYLRKRNPLNNSVIVEEVRSLDNGQVDILEKMSGNELMAIISQLPDGYRTILNLYAVEGYSHKEIGEMLEISENTSRSQYSRARSKLMEMLRVAGIGNEYRSDG